MKAIKTKVSSFQETRKSLVKESTRHHKEPNAKLVFPGQFLLKSKYPEIFIYDEYEYESDDESYVCSDDDNSGSDWSEDEEEDEEDLEKP